MTADGCDPTTGHCITCGDEGIVMRVIELRDGEAVCADELRARHHIAIDLVGPVAVGDALLVHAGVAIRHLGAVAVVGVRG
jgi:hydrogenase maturation factor